MDKDFKEIGKILVASESASKLYSHYSGKQKADFLRQIAVEIEHLGDNLIETAAIESHLPLARLTGERARTTGQLRLFAEFLEEGSWVDAVIDLAIPDRQPLPKVDLRKMLVPIGPVVVFGASNFPLAFSTAGGDTASALAAGCPVLGILPDTSEIALMITSSESGVVVSPGDVSGLIAVFQDRAARPEVWASWGQNARLASENQYALTHVAATYKALFATL